jgi:hypothetical protein
MVSVRFCATDRQSPDAVKVFVCSREFATFCRVGAWRYCRGMCRNITALRGLEPEATTEEIRAAALQYVRKVAGISAVSDTTRDAIERAVAEIAESTTRLLAELPPRKQPPANLPPLRRPEVRARIAARAAKS